jgi:hypothetical protein
MELFQIDFFHLVICILVSYMFFYGLTSHFFSTLNNKYSIAWINHSLCIYHSSLLLKEHLGCFQVWAIMNKAAINICIQFLGGRTLYLSQYNPPPLHSSVSFMKLGGLIFCVYMFTIVIASSWIVPFINMK